jgi:hypothetical protein
LLLATLEEKKCPHLQKRKPERCPCDASLLSGSFRLATENP